MNKLIFAFCILFTSLAFAHGTHDWMRQNKYKDPVTNEWCCGEKDCFHDIKVSRQGLNYIVKWKKYTYIVPPERVQHSEDKNYWICVNLANPKEYRCFFVPIPGV